MVQKEENVSSISKLTYSLVDEINLIKEELTETRSFYATVKKQLDLEYSKVTGRTEISTRSTGGRVNYTFISTQNQTLVSLRSNIRTLINDLTNIKFKINEQVMKIEAIKKDEDVGDKDNDIIRELMQLLGKQNKEIDKESKASQLVLNEKETEKENKLSTKLEFISEEDDTPKSDLNYEKDDSLTDDELFSRFKTVYESIKKETPFEIFYNLDDGKFLFLVVDDLLDLEDFVNDEEATIIKNYLDSVKDTLVIDEKDNIAVDKNQLRFETSRYDDGEE